MAQVDDHDVPAVPAPAPQPVRVLRHVPEFDGIRGVAVLLVVWFHIGLLRALPVGFKPTGGYLGVDMFFVLSGFLITALLLNEQARRKRAHFGAFYRRRALRLLPVIVAFGIAHVIFAHMIHVPVEREKSGIISMIFYYTNWQALHSIIPPAFGQLWSLAVEEQFYLVWPLVLAVLTVRVRLRTVVIVLGSAILFVAIRRALLFDHGTPVGDLLIRTDTRADTLLVGALLAHVWVRKRLSFRGLALAGWISAAFLALCVLRLPFTSGFLYRGGMTIIAIAVAIVLLAVLDSNWTFRRLLRLRPLRAVGRVSYGLYVWHPLVFWWTVRYTIHWRAGPRFLFGIGVTALVTFISWNLIETPFLDWKRRIERRGNEREAIAAET